MDEKARAGAESPATLALGGYAFTAKQHGARHIGGPRGGRNQRLHRSGVAYTLNASTPSNIDAVTFTLNPTAASVVKAQLVSGGGYYSCTNAAGSVTCATTSPQATVAAANQLTVLATS